MSAGKGSLSPSPRKLALLKCTVLGEVFFIAEAIAAMRPAWHLLLSDTDVAPTALFEVEELLRLSTKVCHSRLEACTPGIIVGTEPHQDVNAGLVIFPGTRTPAPARWPPSQSHGSQAAPRTPPHKANQPPPTTTLSDQQVFALASVLTHAEHNRMAALSRTPPGQYPCAKPSRPGPY